MECRDDCRSLPGLRFLPPFCLDNTMRRLIRMFNPISSSIKDKNAAMLFVASISVIIILIDYFTDPIVEVHLFYIVLAGMVAWLASPILGYIFAVVLPPIHYLPRLASTTEPADGKMATNILIQIAVMCVTVYLISAARRLFEEVTLARRKIPICDYCKAVEGPGGEWETIETFLQRQGDIKFTHGLCPKCAERPASERQRVQEIDNLRLHTI